MKFHGDKTLILMVVVATGSLQLAACSSVPKWVDKGGGDMTAKDGKAFYGVRDGDPERAAGQRDRRQPRPCRPGQVRGYLYVLLDARLRRVDDGRGFHEDQRGAERRARPQDLRVHPPLRRDGRGPLGEG